MIPYDGRQEAGIMAFASLAALILFGVATYLGFAWVPKSSVASGEIIVIDSKPYTCAVKP